MNFTIIGAGKMGSALAVPLSDNGHTVHLCGTTHDEEVLEALADSKLHPGLKMDLPEEVTVQGPEEWGRTLPDCDVLVLGVNTAGLEPSLRSIGSALNSDRPLLVLAKGFLEVDGDSYTAVDGVRQLLDRSGQDGSFSVASLAGPTLAGEVARRSPTVAGLSGTDLTAVRTIAGALQTDTFRAQVIADSSGQELCAAFKNVYSIALSWPAGMSEKRESDQSNLNALILLRILKELVKLVIRAGGAAETVYGPPGIGDLVTTSGNERNGELGRRLGRGETVEDALNRMKEEGIHTVEGHMSISSALRFVTQLEGVSLEDLPVLKALKANLMDDTAVGDLLSSLITSDE